MSKTKYKTTSFAKFFFFMLFFMPLAYFGVSMAKGGDFESIKHNISSKIASFKNGLKNSSGSGDYQAEISKKDEEIQALREELFKCQNK